jgi:diadenosine tetraphosphate (Ap4A) HIT family hydrolase
MCIFCDIIRGESPAYIIHEDKTVIAFLDIYPMTCGHVLVVPKQHAVSITALPAPVVGCLMEVGQKVDVALRSSGLPCEGVTFFLADGRIAGQEIMHVHLHVFPRYNGDALPMFLNPAYRKPVTAEDLNQDAEKIRLVLNDSPDSKTN